MEALPRTPGRAKRPHPQFRYLLALLIFLPLLSLAQQARWTEDRADKWYQLQPWLVGANYIPADAINELEMWQAATFNPSEIDREFGWAQDLGMNTMRVFLHNLVWEQDAAGYRQRIDQFLTIAQRHHIRPVFVLLDSCWDPYPKLGPQRPAIPGVHNSGWVQAPGSEMLKDPEQYHKVKSYVQGVVGAFANDSRILAWDVWNEPENDNATSYGKIELKNKEELVTALLPQVFEWAREVHPSQPLTSGIWHNFASLEDMRPLTKIQLNQSDVISFHLYSWPEQFERRVQELEKYHRPLICTEYMARGVGSTFDAVLPIAKKYKVGAINWGLVAGKTQTYLPWDSWERPYVLEKPPVWFHDVFYPDGTLYREREGTILRELTGTP